LGFDGRSLDTVGFDGGGTDDVWFSIWGTDPWMDYDPHQISGWLLRPPASWIGAGTWICGQAGTITRHADHSVAATLSALSLLPACGEAGGSETLHADVIGGVAPLDSTDAAGGCQIAFRANDTRVTLIVGACPQMGVPMPLDGARAVFGDAFVPGDMPITTACLGAGAQLTRLPDSLPDAAHLLIDVPSMSVPQSCAGTPVSGELGMSVAGVHPG
jgi:hypothetical protein